MSRIGITEDDKQRVLAIQNELNLGTQQDAMQVILDAADTAISLADELGLSAGGAGCGSREGKSAPGGAAAKSAATGQAR